MFQKSVMGDSEVTASATQSASMTELATNIAGDKWGIGYAGFGAYNKANADGQVLTAMKVDGVEATAENIISGAYTIQRPVMFVTGAEITPSEQAFIDYISHRQDMTWWRPTDTYLPLHLRLNLRRENAGEIVREIFP